MGRQPITGGKLRRSLGVALTTTTDAKIVMTNNKNIKRQERIIRSSLGITTCFIDYTAPVLMDKCESFYEKSPCALS
jgi:hypothetical protein